MERRHSILDNLKDLLNDLSHLTDIKLKEWKFKWYKQKEYYPLDENSLADIVPDSPGKYKKYTEQFESVQSEQKSLSDELSTIKKLSGI